MRSGYPLKVITTGELTPAVATTIPPEETPKEEPAPVGPLVGTLCAQFLRSCCIAFMTGDCLSLYSSQFSPVLIGLKSGLLGFLGFSAASRLTHFVWGAQDWRSFSIVTGQELLSSLAMGATIGKLTPTYVLI
jgi:hypothetical protein